ncbi:MAG: transporter [Hyphomicrobiales bacterium]|nr:transporter [Hyphomicrobiales bacterium]
MFVRILALVALFSVVAPASFAHEGHDHAAAPPSAPAASGAPRFEAATEAFELVAVRRGSDLVVWLDRFDTNVPVTDATVEVETPDGPQAAAATPEGTYRLPAPWAQRPGGHELLFTVTAGETVDLLTGTLVVPEIASSVAAVSDPARFASGPFGLRALAAAGVGGLVLGGLLAGGLRTRRSLLWAPALGILALLAFGATRLLAHEGHVHESQPPAPTPGGDRAQALPDGSVFIPKPTQRVLGVRTLMSRPERFARRAELPGRIIADPNSTGLVQAASTGRLSPPQGGFPRLGARVKAGDLLAHVSRPFLAIDQSTMRQQQGDLDQQISILERRLARFETLVKSGAVSQVTLDEAKLELRGLRDKRAALESVKQEPEALRAPVSGVIAASNAVAGLMADPATTIFQIVDPDRLFVEALSIEAPQPGLDASARTPDGRALGLTFVGAGLADRNQATPVHFAVTGDNAGLRLGQFVTVFTQTRESVEGLAAPRASVVRRANGESVVYAHVAAERFEPRLVRTRPLDAQNVLIVSGLEPGTRIVSEGAELLNQVR